MAGDSEYGVGEAVWMERTEVGAWGASERIVTFKFDWRISIHVHIVVQFHQCLKYSPI